MITILQTTCMPNFVKIGQFLIFRQFRALCTSKIKSCPILTKFGVHIVWIRLIIKIKKNFEKIYFSDKFLSWTVHCARYQSEILIFFSRFQNIYMWGISKKSEVAQDMFNLLSKSENEGTCYTHVHCAQIKNILANEPSPQRCWMMQVSRKSVILSLLEVLWHTKITC